MRSTPLCAFAVFLIVFTTAHARLGESMQELNARYGASEEITGKDPHAKLLPGAREFKWRRDSGEVVVIVHEGKSVSERIQLPSKATKEADAGVVRDANANGSRWSFKEREKQWRRVDGKAIAYWFNHEWFFVTDAAYEKASQKVKDSPSSVPSVSGF
jgi:hypothetical protein